MDRIQNTDTNIYKPMFILPPVWNSVFSVHNKQSKWMGRLTQISLLIQNTPFVKLIQKEWKMIVINSLTHRNQVSVLQIHKVKSYNIKCFFV